MSNFEKYEAMYKKGVDPNEIYEAAKRSGLGGRDLYTMLQDVLGHSPQQSAKRVKADGYSLSRAIRRSPSAPTSNREQFRRIFDTTLEVAARIVETTTNHPTHRNFRVELHGVGDVGHPLVPGEAFDILYLGDDDFYSIVNVIITGATDDHITVRMDVTGHGPDSFDKTWNQPDGAGPFKFVNLDAEAYNLVKQVFAEIREDLDL